MPQPFKHEATSLHDFFSHGTRGFYVPYYQRNYSWDGENARKLIDDLFAAIKRTPSKPQTSIFLGTVILHKEQNVTVGVHVDTPSLLDPVANVVDGQQRITSLAMLACVVTEQVAALSAQLQGLAHKGSEFPTLATELTDQLPLIKRFYSVEVLKTGAQPSAKPKIIRAGDVNNNPVSDQWTLSGSIDHFYKSSTSTLLSKFIAGHTTDSVQDNERVCDVVEAFTQKIRSELESADTQLIINLLPLGSTTETSLSNFIAYPPSSATLYSWDEADRKLYCAGVYLLALCHFLRNSCYLVVIDCLDLGLAFDMFQSLNATGTPLTAFEVFKPLIVKSWGTSYTSNVKHLVDRIEAVFETEITAAGKEEITDRVIVSSALVFNGLERTRRFSDERDWLVETLENTFGPTGSSTSPAITLKSVELISCIAEQAEYFLNFIKPRRPNKNSQNFNLCGHLQSLGLSATQADDAALCIFFIKDAGHHFAHNVISVFYSKLLSARGNSSATQAAATEFVSICRATAAFFTFYMGAQNSRFPDADYRSLFQSRGSNISFDLGTQNQNSNFVKAAFRRALENQSIYDASNNATAKSIWVASAKTKAWYPRKAVCRFALFAAFHDAAPDTAKGREGLFVNGRLGSANFLNCASWHASQHEVIEHVATRDQPNNRKFPAHFDCLIYPGNFSVVDKIGNLTLLSAKINSSLYSEWPDKAFYFWHLTMPLATTAGPSSSALAAALGIQRVPAGLSSLSAGSSYLPHLAPLALRGQSGLKWDASFIDARSENLCERAFDQLDQWLR